MVQEISRQSSQLIVFDEKVNEIRKLVQSVFGYRVNQIAVELQRLQLWHASKVITLNELQFAAGDDVLEEVWEENLRVKVRQVCRLTLFDPNVFDFEVRVAILMEPVNMSDSIVRCVDCNFFDFTPVQTSEKRWKNVTTS